jgi:hypothetical protein
MDQLGNDLEYTENYRTTCRKVIRGAKRRENNIYIYIYIKG